MPYLLTATMPYGEDDDLLLTIEASYLPPRPAPYAMTPDSPGWSDPGDPEEIEILSATFGDRVVELSDDETERAYEAVREEFARYRAELADYRADER